MSKVKQYRKKPVVVEAIQFSALGLIDWDAIYKFCPDARPRNGELYIKTLEGDMHVSSNDYIIKGVQGEFYPCKPDIFHATYEAVEKEATTTPMTSDSEELAHARSSVRTAVVYRTEAQGLKPDYEKNNYNSSDEVQFEACVFSDGRCAQRWLTPTGSMVWWDSWEDLCKVHVYAHPDYGTRVEWSDGKVELL